MVTQDQLNLRGAYLISAFMPKVQVTAKGRKRGWLDSDVPADQDRCGGTQIMKLDLVMWTYNGERTLNPVLQQINRVVPRSLVGQKLIVDDGSTDQTTAIAKCRGWKVIHNEGKRHQ